jgi:hypothetical protein
MYLLAIREIILWLSGGGKTGDRQSEKSENKVKEVEKKEEETKQETPHSFSTSVPPSSFSLQDILLKKKNK